MSRTTLPAEGLPVPCFGVKAPSAIQKHGPRRVLLAAPRGYCAGVDRAVQTVEHAL
ncbi:MAG: 4-hydroxy-3-methylbut-2-enyl diphosphate reductase, partial [Solirubrobacterales bacterium]